MRWTIIPTPPCVCPECLKVDPGPYPPTPRPRRQRDYRVLLKILRGWVWLFEFRVYLLAAIIIGATPFRSSYPPPDAKYDPDKGVWWIGLAAGVNFALFMHEWNKRRDAR